MMRIACWKTIYGISIISTGRYIINCVLTFYYAKNAYCLFNRCSRYQTITQRLEGGYSHIAHSTAQNITYSSKCLLCYVSFTKLTKFLHTFEIYTSLRL